MKLGNSIISRILKEKCPNCGDGEVYVKKAHFFQLPVMNEKCSSCSYRFEREPGYFLGAMYLSYGLAILQGMITFIILKLVSPDISLFWLISVIISVIVVFSMKNFKLSRILYIYIFPK